ncbi:ATP-binding protein [Spirochaeta africana]|uniref:ATP-binding protein n=1 Tax=Spirochaeta africana TaxID=46355 RepID=UPI0002474F7C|nr:AAA family ATPase [Spirochaeta africana]
MFFLDEIQQLQDFESGLRYLQNQNTTVIITGSNSAMFSRNLAESLRGKVLTYELFPLSFSEFLRFRDFPEKSRTDSRHMAERNVLLDEYLHHLEESLFLITLRNRANPAAARKIYLTDNGLYQTLRSSHGSPQPPRYCGCAANRILPSLQPESGYAQGYSSGP